MKTEFSGYYREDDAWIGGEWPVADCPVLLAEVCKRTFCEFDCGQPDRFPSG